MSGHVPQVAVEFAGGSLEVFLNCRDCGMTAEMDTTGLSIAPKIDEGERGYELEMFGRKPRIQLGTIFTITAESTIGTYGNEWSIRVDRGNKVFFLCHDCSIRVMTGG